MSSSSSSSIDTVYIVRDSNLNDGNSILFRFNHDSIALSFSLDGGTTWNPVKVNATSGGGSTGGDYEPLLNKPSVNSIILTGNKTGAQLGLIDNPSGGSSGQLLQKTSDGVAWTTISGYATEDWVTSNYQSKITSSNKLPYSLVSDTPTLATVATTGNYSDLNGTPTIPSTATDISITDTGGYFTGSTVEAALQEVGAQLDGLVEELESI